MTRPLPDPINEVATRAMSDVMDRLERAWYPNEVTNIDESWDYQSWPADEFMGGLELASTMATGREFLDIGSGIGTKLALASGYGFKPRGIEFRPQYAAMSSYICPEARVYDIDARVFNGYGEFDVIYAYLPLRRMRVLLELVTEKAHAKAVLFMPECPELSELGWRQVSALLPVWVRRAE